MYIQTELGQFNEYISTAVMNIHEEYKLLRRNKNTNLILLAFFRGYTKAKSIHRNTNIKR